MGIQELSLGDTIGVATPNQVVDVLTLLLTTGGIPLERLAVHFHDTRGTALPMCWWHYKWASVSSIPRQVVSEVVHMLQVQPVI